MALRENSKYIALVHVGLQCAVRLVKGNANHNDGRDITESDKRLLIQLKSDLNSGDAIKKTRVVELGMALSVVEKEQYGQYVMDFLRDEKDFFA